MATKHLLRGACALALLAGTTSAKLYDDPAELKQAQDEAARQADKAKAGASAAEANPKQAVEAERAARESAASAEDKAAKSELLHRRKAVVDQKAQAEAALARARYALRAQTLQGQLDKYTTAQAELEQVEQERLQAESDLRVAMDQFKASETPSDSDKEALNKARLRVAQLADQAAKLEAQVKAKNAPRRSLPWTVTQSAGQKGAYVNQYYTALLNPQGNPLGASFQPVEGALRRHLKLADKTGLLVTGVQPGGPAARVGLKEMDVLVAADDTPIGQSDDLIAALKKAGEKTVSLKLRRGGKETAIEVRPTYRVSIEPVAQKKEADYYIGVPVRPLEAALRAQLNVPEDRGLVVNEVMPNSPAAKAGLKPDDILLAVGDSPLPNTETLVGRIQKSGGKPVELKILRDGEPMTITVTPEARPADLRSSNDAEQLYELVVPAQAVQSDLLQRLDVKLFNPAQLTKPESGGRPTAVKDAKSDEDRRLEALTAEIKALRKELEALKAGKNKQGE